MSHHITLYLASCLTKRKPWSASSVAAAGAWSEWRWWWRLMWKDDSNARCFPSTNAPTQPPSRMGSYSEASMIGVSIYRSKIVSSSSISKFSIYMCKLIAIRNDMFRYSISYFWLNRDFGRKFSWMNTYFWIFCYYLWIWFFIVFKIP